MRIRVDCEESQALTIELRKIGIEAFSCDTEDCSGGYEKWHIKADCLTLDRTGFDTIISFPPCTHLAVSGAKHFEQKRKDGRQEAGIRFFFEVWKYSDCTENPVGILNGGEYIKKWFPELHAEMLVAGFPFKPTQIIQPWQFGDEAQKTTCLWLKNLPPLTHTRLVGKGAFYTAPSGKVLPAWYGDAVGQNGKTLSYNGAEIKKVRSKTFPGIAKAMAEQWGGYMIMKDLL